MKGNDASLLQLKAPSALDGEVCPPGSKSLTNRALLLYAQNADVPGAARSLDTRERPDNARGRRLRRRVCAADRRRAAVCGVGWDGCALSHGSARSAASGDAGSGRARRFFPDASASDGPTARRVARAGCEYSMPRGGRVSADCDRSQLVTSRRRGDVFAPRFVTNRLCDAIGRQPFRKTDARDPSRGDSRTPLCGYDDPRAGAFRRLRGLGGR